MDKRTHVYCTNCINVDHIFKCIEEKSSIPEISGQPEYDPCISDCPCFLCHCLDLEDSRPFGERPKYERA